MKLRIRFTGTGSLGALFFVGATLLSGLAYTDMMRRALSPYSQPWITAQPFLYVVLSTIGALGIAMMLSGREIVSERVAKREEAEAAKLRTHSQPRPAETPGRAKAPIDPARYKD